MPHFKHSEAQQVVLQYLPATPALLQYDIYCSLALWLSKINCNCIFMNVDCFSLLSKVPTMIFNIVLLR